MPAVPIALPFEILSEFQYSDYREGIVLVILIFVASAVSLMIATGCFRANQQYRGAIDKALGGEMDVPERVWPYYDASYLNKFIAMAEQRSTVLGKKVLDLYLRPTLLWIDVGFAIFCAAFASLFWYGLLSALPSHRWVECTLQFFIAMSVLYGVFDVGEDLWLARLFIRRSNVARYEGTIACALTDLKVVTICLSILGAALFWLLGKVFANDRGS